MKIKIADHVIMGNSGHSSLRGWALRLEKAN